jgi:hypothetical protein
VEGCGSNRPHSCGYPADTRGIVAEKLNDKLVKALPPPARGSHIVYNAAVPGFGIRLIRAGSRSFILNYRVRDSRKERRYTIGDAGRWDATQMLDGQQDD